MRAFAVDEFGQTGQVRDLEDPQPGEGQIRIRVAASGLNPFDAAVLQGFLKDRMEHHFPLIPGMDGSGTIDAVGAAVEHLSVGDDVFGSVGKSTLGEGRAGRAGDDVRRDDRPQAGFPRARGGGRAPGGRGHGAGDGRRDRTERGRRPGGPRCDGRGGGYLMQLASRRGARVVGVCRGENADYARRLGAADVVDYTAGDVAEAVRSRYPDGIHSVADLHGDREQVAGLAEQVRSGGHVSSAVGSAGTPTPWAPGGSGPRTSTAG